MLREVTKALRLRGPSQSTERKYLHLILDYPYFLKARNSQFVHPKDFGTVDMRDFLHMLLRSMPPLTEIAANPHRAWSPVRVSLVLRGVRDFSLSSRSPGWCAARRFR